MVLGQHHTNISTTSRICWTYKYLNVSEHYIPTRLILVNSNRWFTPWANVQRHWASVRGMLGGLSCVGCETDTGVYKSTGICTALPTLQDTTKQPCGLDNPTPPSYDHTIHHGNPDHFTAHNIKLQQGRPSSTC